MKRKKLKHTPKVIWVHELGTTDPAQAIYIGGRLAVSEPRRSHLDLIGALGLEISVRAVSYGFYDRYDQWPNKLSDLCL